MAQKTRTELKAYFNVGDFPTETEFANFIDSIPNLIDDGICCMQSVTKTYADFQPAGATIKFIDLFAFPANHQIEFLVLRNNITFNGGGTNLAKLSFYNGNDAFYFFNMVNLDVFLPISNRSGSIYYGINGFTKGILDIAGGNVRVKLEASGAGVIDIDNLTQGSFTVYYKLQALV